MDWNPIVALGTVFGAVATFFACLIALYQSRKANVKSLKLQIIYDTVLLNSDDDRHFIELSITNVGNRNVIIISTGYRVRNKAQFAHINPHMTTDGIITPFAQHELNPEHGIAFFYEKTNLLEYLTKEFNSCPSIKMFAMDSTGRYYYVKIKKNKLFK